MSVRIVKLSDLCLDSGTQLRHGLDEATCDEYAEAWRRKDKFPPLTAFKTPEGRLLLVDGFHRLEGARRAGIKEICVEIREGTLREAILFSAGVNATHGLRRSNRDKQRAVRTMLSDDEWAKWTDRKIARHCGVSHTFVASLRGQVVQSGNGCQIEPRDGDTLCPRKSKRRDYANVRIPRSLRSECCEKGRNLSERVTELIKLGIEYETLKSATEGVVG